MIIVWLAIIGATVVTAILTGLLWVFGRKTWPSWRDVGLWAARLWAINVVLDLLILYFAMPALTGPYGGWQWLLWPLAFSAIYVIFGGSVTQARGAFASLNARMSGFGGFGSRTGRGRVVSSASPGGHSPQASAAAGGSALALVALVALVVNGLIVVSTTWFDPNAKALAAIPNIVAAPRAEALPPTDVNHIVLVTQDVASYLGQQALTASGQNLGSIYHTEPTEYTLQSVRHHLYWIAPLVYNNVWANLGQWQSPGYVVVDAEDPNASPQLRTGYHMRYLPDALLNQDLTRHVYLSGYTWGNLADPTLEVDDNWRPYFTVSLMQPSRGFTGDVVSRVLVVDTQTGAISDYPLTKVPSWVDRVIPAQWVDQYLQWWGLYHAAPWFNPSGQGQQAPSTDMPELVYNQVDQPVWLEPMTSSAATDNSSTGVILFDTRDMTGRLYNLTGLGSTSNVVSAFQSNPANIRNYNVNTVELYQIYGEPTWVATFTQPNPSGAIFQAVGMVDARHLLGSNVIMAPDKATALAGYAQWLADHSAAGTGPAPSGKQVTATARLVRVSAATESGATVYYMTLSGHTQIFKAGLALSPQLPLAQPGDTVTVTYLDTGQSVVTLTAFTDKDVTPGIASPAATLVATPTP